MRPSGERQHVSLPTLPCTQRISTGMWIAMICAIRGGGPKIGALAGSQYPLTNLISLFDPAHNTNNFHFSDQVHKAGGP
jgi:hypothetical protein